MMRVTVKGGLPVLASAYQWFQRNRIYPVKAGLAVSRLLRDPDDTGQVFKVLEALRGDSLGRAHRRLLACEQGEKLLSDKPAIVRALNDRESLLGMPEGSIGRAYYDFVHAEGLSADGLIASSEEAPFVENVDVDMRWLGDRLRDIHDLQHVMTGYGRDPVGELSLLSFMTTQTPGRGIDFIIFMGRQKFKKDHPEIDINALIHEGRQIGQQADWMLLTQWENRLHEPIADVREELGFSLPQKYYAVKRDFLEAGSLETSLPSHQAA
ncbi:Coq4 family protein [Candidatus Marimicrobium litorale]|uniref:Coq4 family protein n=1 Tax=Candidatus Marimicrobium litorale TaxID=2518991 RepID=UPI00242D9499|nr:Coq4 family protein [Candidatus Marimicrobium litorale]